MSSIYVIPNKPTIENKIPIEDWDENEDYIIVGRTHDFDYKIRNFVEYISDDAPIVCIDNGTNVTNFKQLKEYYKK